MGIYISGHPLDDYRIVLTNLCNTHCKELGDKKELFKKGGRVTVGGVVTGVRTGFSKNGSAYGIVTIEDFDGPGELALFGEDWGKYNSMFLEGSSVFVEALMSQRYQGSNYIDFVVSKVSYLNDVKEKNLRSITINIDPTALSEVTVENLMSLINDNPGNTELFFSVKQPDGRGYVGLHAKTKGVNLVYDLVMLLEQEDALSYVINA